MGLRGPVKTIVEEAVDPTTGTANQPGGERKQQEFDPEGRLLIYRGASGGSEWVSTNTYDGNGRFLQSTSASAGSVYHETAYEYDDEGRLARYTSKGSQGATETKITYDANGQKSATHRFDAQVFERNRKTATPGPSVGLLQMAELGFGVPDGGSVRTIYDPCDQPVEAEILSVDGQVVQRIVRTYDAANRLVEEKQIVINPDYMIPGGVRAQMMLQSGATLEGLRERLGKFFGGQDGLSKISNTYDNQGRLLETCVRKAPFYEQRRIVKYNEAGDISEERITTRGAYGAKLDEHGNVTPDVSPVPEPTQISSRRDYTYDDRGNWVEQTSSVAGGSQGQFQTPTIRRRQITYY